ncbi:ribosome biogenesis GTP-binding protein YihA/YsxC [Blattabacterium cuenoti]|uniref:ribosome biogenesis GTP-binding protein YihA/YsxC n=1 Tax=Blattabacterium cuenoti TaxID=1653831 RepID=UPI00163B95E4|nr:ribosome biogenesis GTP-binding protein YihA/YsxC [Blattabacterium cuenoti]
MKIISVQFEGSKIQSNQLFLYNFPEYAFIGRTNVGKSSLINWITNRRKLAKISSFPGRTQFINPFLINHQWYLIDLPGYGYSSICQKKKKKIQKLMMDYIFYRKNLVNLFLLIDSRIFLQKSDIHFIQKLKFFQIPFCIVFTKTDKIYPRILNKNIDFFKKEFEKIFFSMPKYFKVSIKNRSGREKIIQYINEIYKKNFSLRRKTKYP